MDAFFSATLSRPPLERVLIWVVRARGTLIGCHGQNIRSIFRGRYPHGGARTTCDCLVILPDRRHRGMNEERATIPIAGPFHMRFPPWTETVIARAQWNSMELFDVNDKHILITPSYSRTMS
jgi:hypothetical protein